MIAGRELFLLGRSSHVVDPHVAGRGSSIGSNQLRRGSVLAPQLVCPQGGTGSAARIEDAHPAIAVDFQEVAGHFIDLLLTGTHCATHVKGVSNF